MLRKDFSAPFRYGSTWSKCQAKVKKMAFRPSERSASDCSAAEKSMYAKLNLREAKSLKTESATVRICAKRTQTHTLAHAFQNPMFGK